MAKVKKQNLKKKANQAARCESKSPLGCTRSSLDGVHTIFCWQGKAVAKGKPGKSGGPRLGSTSGKNAACVLSLWRASWHLQDDIHVASLS